MKIKCLSLFTNQFEAEKFFYSKTLGCDLKINEADKFSIEIGNSTLIFNRSEVAHIYHYCFLIPSNQINTAKEWLVKRLTLIELDKHKFIQRWESWNADAIYFYDASGNIVEFIARYDLKNESSDDFGIKQIISINEIGMPSKHVRDLNIQLKESMNCDLWKGDLERFSTNGDQNGLFLIPNYLIKKEWFPTNNKIEPSPFEAIVENDNKEYALEFKDEILTINPHAESTLKTLC